MVKTYPLSTHAKLGGGGFQTVTGSNQLYQLLLQSSLTVPIVTAALSKCSQKNKNKKKTPLTTVAISTDQCTTRAEVWGAVCQSYD